MSRSTTPLSPSVFMETNTLGENQLHKHFQDSLSNPTTLFSKQLNCNSPHEKYHLNTTTQNKNFFYKDTFVHTEGCTELQSPVCRSALVPAPLPPSHTLQRMKYSLEILYNFVWIHNASRNVMQARI
jgi:hypothetical protein